MKKDIRVLVITNLSIKNSIITSLKNELGNIECIHSSSVVFYKYENDLSFISESLNEYDLIFVWNSFFFTNENIVHNFLMDDIGDEEMKRLIFDYYDCLYSRVNKVYNGILISVLDNNILCMDYKLWEGCHVKSDLIYEVNAMLTSRYKRINFIDIAKEIAKIGIHNSINGGPLSKWGVLYSTDLIKEISKSIYSIYQIYLYGSPKCIVLDCDNVLWGGIISECGSDNILIADEGEGKIYKQFQRFVQLLFMKGIIIALCSKNNLEDVKKIFDNNYEMVLKWDMIAAAKINWYPKIDNIVEIANELNIDMNSMIFVDDDVHEIKMMSETHPEVKSVLFEPYRFDDIYKFFYLQIYSNNEEALLRQKNYQQNKLRNELKEHCSGRNDYISKLETEISISVLAEEDYVRCAELLQRSNKCTIGIRYSLFELKKIDKCKMYTVIVNDKYGSLGKVGFMGIENNKIKFFALSCRALGRNVENEMIRFLQNQSSCLWAEIVDTGRNENLRELLQKELGEQNVEYK